MGEARQFIESNSQPHQTSRGSLELLWETFGQRIFYQLLECSHTTLQTPMSRLRLVSARNYTDDDVFTCFSIIVGLALYDFFLILAQCGCIRKEIRSKPRNQLIFLDSPNMRPTWGRRSNPTMRMFSRVIDQTSPWNRVWILKWTWVYVKWNRFQARSHSIRSTDLWRLLVSPESMP